MGRGSGLYQQTRCDEQIMQSKPRTAIDYYNQAKEERFVPQQIKQNSIQSENGSDFSQYKKYPTLSTQLIWLILKTVSGRFKTS